jgi:hypothetical protein
MTLLYDTWNLPNPDIIILETKYNSSENYRL